MKYDGWWLETSYLTNELELVTMRWTWWEILYPTNQSTEAKMDEKINIEEFKIKWKDFLASNSYGDLSKDIRNLFSECERYERRIRIMYELNHKMSNEVKELETRIQLAESTRDDALAYAKMYKERVEDLQYIMTCDPDHWDSAFVKWSTEKDEARIKKLERVEEFATKNIFFLQGKLDKAEAKVKELELALKQYKLNYAEAIEVKHTVIEEINKAQEKIKQLEDGIEGVLNQKDLISFVIQKQLEELIKEEP